MGSNIQEFRPKPGDAEKVTINLGYVDLGHIDLMVREGFYSNRTDFIRTAIRNQLERHAEVARKSVARKNLLGMRPGETLFADRSFEARKQLTSLGLTYHDSKQFLEAVKRNDAIAAELFIAGRGVDLSARDFWGRDALDFVFRAEHHISWSPLLVPSPDSIQTMRAAGYHHRPRPTQHGHRH